MWNTKVKHKNIMGDLHWENPFIDSEKPKWWTADNSKTKKTIIKTTITWLNMHEDQTKGKFYDGHVGTATSLTWMVGSHGSHLWGGGGTPLMRVMRQWPRVHHRIFPVSFSPLFLSPPIKIRQVAILLDIQILFWWIG